MRIVSAAKYAALQALQQRTARDRDSVEKVAADRLATIAQLRAELRQQRVVQHQQPAPGDAELRHQLMLARRTVGELQQRLDEMQTSHIADTRELYDLRQGVSGS